ncbi:MAG: hypothetical protein J5809_02480 [Selenomonadaceae bacterium]|nr:hypothetical protein [Selenomonadaceae bacterium]
MSQEKIEQLSDEQLEKVTGGSGIECMFLLQRLKDEGFAEVHTPLVAGYEKAAAEELRGILNGIANGVGKEAFAGTEIYEDDTANVYKFHGQAITADKLINHIRILTGNITGVTGI